MNGTGDGILISSCGPGVGNGADGELARRTVGDVGCDVPGIIADVVDVAPGFPRSRSRRNPRRMLASGKNAEREREGEGESGRVAQAAAYMLRTIEFSIGNVL